VRFLELPGHTTSEVEAQVVPEGSPTRGTIEYRVNMKKQFPSASDATSNARALIVYAKTKQFNGAIEESNRAGNVAVYSKFRHPDSMELA
jgi:hypothetical protein